MIVARSFHVWSPLRRTRTSVRDPPSPTIPRGEPPPVIQVEGDSAADLRRSSVFSIVPRL